MTGKFDLLRQNLDVKRLCNERKEALSAQFAAEASLRRIHSAQKDEEVVPFDAIIGPLESVAARLVLVRLRCSRMTRRRLNGT